MTKQEIPLRFYDTELHQILLNQLAHFHIHPHDIEASVQKKESKYTVILRFGEEFSHEQTRDFTDGRTASGPYYHSGSRSAFG